MITHRIEALQGKQTSIKFCLIFEGQPLVFLVHIFFRCPSGIIRYKKVMDIRGYSNRMQIYHICGRIISAEMHASSPPTYLFGAFFFCCSRWNNIADGVYSLWLATWICKLFLFGRWSCTSLPFEIMLCHFWVLRVEGVHTENNEFLTRVIHWNIDIIID